MDKAKYQHYVPQTYLSKWLDKNNQLYVYNKDKEFVKACKTKNILGIKHLYSKKVHHY